MKNYKGEALEPRILTVKEMDVDDQPRERAMKYGIGSLSTPDLWALILRTGLRGKPITELCRDLMRDNNNSLFTLERRTRAEIMTTPGIGETKGLQVEAVMELIRRYNREAPTKKTIIRSSGDIYSYMRPTIGNLAHEEIWILLLNRRNEIIGERRITTGSSVASVFDLKKILRELILSGCEGVVLCHNHPSGNNRPSPQDDNITKMLKEGCHTIDIRMLDHLILTSSEYFSYSDNGKL